MEKDNSILEVKGLSVAFGDRTVVDNVSYALHRGRTLGIVGESGSGKSVSSMALMGLLPKKATVSGTAMLNGTNLLSLTEDEFRAIRGRRIGMIFQEPMTSLNPVQKCGAQVLEMLRAHKYPSDFKRLEKNEADASDSFEIFSNLPENKNLSERELVIELFKEVLLPRPEKIFDSYPHELSGGQKQRVMIAMALINHPDILIADEPTTALDVTVQKTILELLKSLQEKYGISIIFITHDLGVIAQIADDILVMYRGHVVEQGTADQILHQPQHPYTKGLLACRPPLDSRPKRLPTVEDYLSNEELGMRNEVLTDAPVDPLSNIKPSTLISVKDLTVEYSLKKNLFGKPVQTLKGVDGISFDIMEGETLGLVGESGCGKTTLGRALLRLIDHSSGSISYRGRSLDSLSSREMRALRPKLQIIFQDPYSSLNPRITIGDAIAEPLAVHSRESRISRRDTVIELMEQVGLQSDWYNRYPHELSGGQRQRVCIARALILQPELVVCDESVSALDVSVQAQVLNLLNDLKRRYHYTYLFITHDLSVVKFLSDRIMVMQQGRIVETGTPDELFADPHTEYTRTLISAIPRL